MRKFLLILALLFIKLQAHSNTYYVDPSGSDLNSGNSPSTAWATLSKVSGAVLNPGDQILFIKGGVWYGSITPNPNSYATSSNPITLGAYGAGANPLISGFITTSNWVNAGGGIWTYTNPLLGTTIPGIVTVNGKLQPLGRFPSAGYNIYSTHNSNQSITDNKYTGGKTFLNGEVVIRTAHFVWTKGTITSQNGGSISYTSKSTYTPVNGYTYFIQNHINCLSNVGDWCYNPATKTISMFFGSTSPSAYLIKISNQQTLVNLSSSTPCYVFNGLSFEGANTAFYGIGADNTSIINCIINFMGDNGIDFGYSNNLTIKGNTITDCNNDAIACWYGTSNSNISSNIINRAGLIAGAGENDTGGPYNKGAYSGIVISDLMMSKNNTLNYNTITNIGYNGIQINGDSYTVNENFVNYACSTLDDGGGIYTYVGNSYPTYRSRTISNNIVLNSKGNDLFDYKAANGIYLDNNSFNITLSGNTVAGCEAHGYYLHDNHNVTLNNNFAFNNGISQLIIQYDDPSLSGSNKNLIITNNTFVANTSVQLALLFQSVAPNSSNNDYKQFGMSNNNHFGSLSKKSLLFNAAINWNGGTNMALSDWVALTAQDYKSTSTAPSFIAFSFQYNNKLSNESISLQGAYSDIIGKVYTGSQTISPFSSMLLLSQMPNCNITKPVIQFH